MGGQTSRMVREIVEDSTYIIRQTNRATYEHSRAANAEVQSKLTELRRLNGEMLQSAESDAQRSEVFESFQSTAGQQKKALDEQAEEFAKQFELPISYQKIADAHREEIQKAKVKAEKAAEALKHPEQKQS
ncbi:uncharacterized protein PITG_16976 [Phytophthora infestans T30-4]|uniref:Uncharacterized protein n=2 Tax=Phytophthora infestans TaxID=4787 RepID=D0NUI5_PHYIT|nr:uncharacterized protein PITG_16976 [Phytophthora infestans T30-4]EEY65331.1 conserved hypothetical protein [Phytophthora infestans T30-4]KAF4030312.1 hypothetical protein GN244_ATG17890 [Phytophthora infestans]KAF4131574.1 hypothetical protein GN958_ATG19238 [Phytophthora infestans]KAI9981812.1 hypothetical protein PInf_009591 [Phytophthora infestans]|eukprot:XP_002897194.1 conserved hypothetical protein [Phytophthora infestans T30-4]